MTRLVRTALVGGSALVLGITGTAGAATSSSGATDVVNRETVQAELDSTGKLDVARLFSQLTVTGNGTAVIADPVSGKGLRNLDGFGNPKVKDGKALYTIRVDGGSASRRTVSDFTKSLPVTVTANYRFNGKPAKPKDIVGKTGDVEVKYTVTNVSGTPTEITFKDGKGVGHTETIDLVTPFVGQLTTTLPKSFSGLTAPRADAAGDGHGGTLLAYTMVLFAPIGETTQTFGWSGHVKHAQIPAVTVQIVPVSPAVKPELKFGQDGYRDGAAQAGQLTAGAGQIDANLLRLQRGAGQLLNGLTKLASGAADLRAGLTDKIAPGASTLASGAKDAKAGSAQLSAGLGDLADGAGQLADGVDLAKGGSSALADGLALISGGLDQLGAVDGLPAAKAGAQLLRAGVDALRAGVGAAGTPGTILYGLTQLSGGTTQVSGGLTQVQGGLGQLATGLPQAKGGVDQSKGGVDQVRAGLEAALAAGGPLDQLIAAAQGAYALSLCPAAPAGLPVAGVLPPSSLPAGTTCNLIANLAYGLGLPAGVTTPTDPGGIKAQTSAGSAGLGQVSAGLGQVSTGLVGAIAGVTQLQTGVTQLQGGAAQLSAGLTQVTAGVNQVAVGLQSGDSASPGLAEGLDALVAGLTEAVTGVAALDAGAHDAAAGSTDLDSGLGQLADGAGQVADGAGAAADGGAKLDTGLGRIADGAGQLSNGLDKAAAGSVQLSDGLNQAKAGDRKVVNGAGQLRSEGTSKLIQAGNDTTADNAEKYATLVALGNKVADGGLPYGAPEGATGSAAYDLTLAAATTASHDNAVRTLVALLLLAAACATSWTIRRRVTRPLSR